MAQLPSYLGVPNKGAYEPFLQRAAATDFWHDFHHARSDEILDRLGKSYFIGSGKSKPQFQRLVLELRQQFQGTNIYDMFSQIASQLLLRGVNPDAQNAGSENLIFNNVLPQGLSYEQIRQALINASQDDNPQGFEFGQHIPIGVQNHERPYTIRAVPVKNRGAYAEIAPAFERVSGNISRNFVLMIDASFLSISQLRNFIVDENIIYNFFILQSIENEGDPATKIANFVNESPNVNVYFLRDIGHKTLYTDYNQQGPFSNLYSGCSISASREDGKISAEIEFDGITTEIEDIGKASEPNEAGFLALKKLIESRQPGEANFLGHTEEVMKYFLLKRAGDWCQGLCLLDRGRVYRVQPVGNTPMFAVNECTLDRLRELLPDIQIAALSHDKIFFSYLLSLGLNGYMTIKLAAPANAAGPANPAAQVGGDLDQSSTTVIWLVNFKNEYDDDNVDRIYDLANTKLNMLGGRLNQLLQQEQQPNPANLDNFIRNTYNSFPNQLIQIINGARVDLTIAPINRLIKFLRVARGMLDAISKVNRYPEIEINTHVGNLIQQQQELAQQRAQNQILQLQQVIHFSNSVSKFESDLNSYSQILSFRTNFMNLIQQANQNNLPVLFPEEAAQIATLITNIFQNIPLSRDGVPFKSLEDFIYKTGSELRKNINDVIRLFNPNQEGINQLRTALTLTDENIAQLNLSRVQRLRFLEWFPKYQQAINVQGPQQGGLTEFDNEVLDHLFSNVIRIQEPYRPYNAEEASEQITERLNERYPHAQQENIRSFFWGQAIEQYQNETQRGELKEPYLTKYLLTLLDEYDQAIELAIENQILTVEQVYNFLQQDNQEQAPAPNFEPGNGQPVENNVNNVNPIENELDIILENTIQNVRPLFVNKENIIDIGESVTFEGGEAFTAVDNNLVTGDHTQIFDDFFQRLTGVLGNPGNPQFQQALQSDDVNAYTIILYKFILFNLDRISNTVHTLTETYNNEEPILQQDGYLTGDSKIYAQKANIFVNTILNLLQQGTVQQKLEALLQHVEDGYINENNFIPENDNYISKEFLEKRIAICKTIAILQYYFLINRPLDPFQAVRLFYLLSPSLEALNELPNVLPPVYHEATRIAYAFQYTSLRGELPPNYAAIFHQLNEHATAYGDEFFELYIQLNNITRDIISLAFYFGENQNFTINQEYHANIFQRLTGIQLQGPGQLTNEQVQAFRQIAGRYQPSINVALPTFPNNQQALQALQHLGGRSKRYRKTRSKARKAHITHKRRLAVSRKKKVLKSKKATRKI
jgi:hypothetical protein